MAIRIESNDLGALVAVEAALRDWRVTGAKRGDMRRNDERVMMGKRPLAGRVDGGYEDINKSACSREREVPRKLGGKRGEKRARVLPCMELPAVEYVEPTQSEVAGSGNT